MTYPLVNLDLARRLERAEGHANTRFIESRMRCDPGVGAAWCAVDGAYAMFDGVGSPLTQTFGLGIFEPLSSEGLDEIERFFVSRGADVFHEVSPLADPSVLALLNERGYRPCEFTSVMFRPTAPDREQSRAVDVHARPARRDELGSWAEVAARGWSEFPEVLDFMTAFGSITAGAVDCYPFVAEIDQRPIATGIVVTHDDVALLAGASTVPEGRGRGAQTALLEARLAFGARQGCTLAMMCAAPGSASQRNAERRGFRIAYTRIKWHKPAQEFARR